MKSKINRKKIIRILIILAIVMILAFASLLASQLGLLEFIKKNNQEPKQITVNDECSLIFGQILHPINNEDSCRIKCRTECETRQLKLFKSNFESKNDSCNNCSCYCK